MKNPNLNRFEIKSAEDIHTHIQNQKNISNYHLLELVKKTFTNISIEYVDNFYGFFILHFEVFISYRLYNRARNDNKNARYHG